MKEKQYYTTEEVAQGVGELPPISKTTLRNLRSARKIKYTKVGNQCVYKLEWIEDYLNGNIVEVGVQLTVADVTEFIEKKSDKVA